ncbi:hypothetical protein [Mycobacterium sp. SMC-17]|uniref:hypothetical protein n=1 Tax=Mycobacterium sp. SMC-17 TaxID=3381628 RepID=UPI0038774163
MTQFPQSRVHDVVLRRPAVLASESGDHEDLVRQFDFRHVGDARSESDAVDPAVHEGRDGHRLRRVGDRVPERDRRVIGGRRIVLDDPGVGRDDVVVGVEVVECAAEIIVRAVVRIVARRLVIEPVIMVGRQRQSW